MPCRIVPDPATTRVVWIPEVRSAPAPVAWTTDADPIATCEYCGRDIRVGEPYRAPIPFVGSWGGLVHDRRCLRLVR